MTENTQQFEHAAEHFIKLFENAEQPIYLTDNSEIAEMLQSVGRLAIEVVLYTPDDRYNSIRELTENAAEELIKNIQPKSGIVLMHIEKPKMPGYSEYARSVIDDLERLAILQNTPVARAALTDDEIAQYAKSDTLDTLAEYAAAWEKELTAQNSKTTTKAAAYQKNRGEYLANTLPEYLESRKTTPPLKTGFDNLDEILNGGLQEGLYTIGAISSLGKTTFCLQMADNIASLNDRDILFISLEMGQYELLTKSIVRTAFEMNLTQYGGKASGKIMANMNKLPNYNDIANGYTGTAAERAAKQERTQNALELYKLGTGSHIYHIEADGAVTIDEIEKMIQYHFCHTFKPPVVFVDYMQIITPMNDRYSDKQNLDQINKSLKQLSRKYHTPIVGISAVNRANYNNSAEYESFSGSSGIEYSCTVLIALQYSYIDSPDYITPTGRTKDDKEATRQEIAKAAKSRMPKELTLKILKNRFGQKDKAVNLYFYPAFNYFEERKGGTIDLNKDTKPDTLKAVKGFDED